MLKVLLTSMQDNNWLGTILVGAPGTGKTLSSVCTGNTFQVRTLVGDLGAARTARADIERLRDLAENLGVLSANQPGVYRRPKEINGRDISRLAVSRASIQLPGLCRGPRGMLRPE